MAVKKPPLDLSKPRYDRTTYIGRLKHFILLTNPLNLLASKQELDEAKLVVDNYKQTKIIPPDYDEEKIWKAKYLYDSAYHPDTGGKMSIIGCMSAQVPMNTLLMAGMLTFYKTKPQIVFWQWLNQSFASLVNYTNRSGDADISVRHIFLSYCAACGGAVCTVVYLNRIARRLRNRLFAKLAPFGGVCTANCINIPTMRSHELAMGTPVFTIPHGHRVGDSTIASTKGVCLVCCSRCLMAVPGLTFAPYITNYAASHGLFCTRPMLSIPFQATMVALGMAIATPTCCALWDQQDTLGVEELETELQEIIMKKYKGTKQVSYNKGL